MTIVPSGLRHAAGVVAVPGGNALPASIDSWKTAPCRSSTLRYANLNRLDLSDDASPASRHRRRTGQEDAAKSLVHHRAADGVADAHLFRPAEAVDSQTDHERRTGVRRRNLIVAGLRGTAAIRSRERAVGKECASQCMSRLAPYH